jgi:hypothetical protein
MTENEWGKERKMNGGPATANQVRDRWKKLKQKSLQTESALKKAFNHAASPKSIALDINAFRKSCIHTPYICSHIKVLFSTR